MPEEQGAPMPAPGPQEGGQDQMMQQLAGLAQELIGQLGPEGAAMLAQIIMEMLQGGGGAPAEELGGAPAEQQFMRCGGKIKKMACGSKTKKVAKKKKC